MPQSHNHLKSPPTDQSEHTQCYTQGLEPRKGYRAGASIQGIRREGCGIVRTGLADRSLHPPNLSLAGQASSQHKVRVLALCLGALCIPAVTLYLDSVEQQASVLAKGTFSVHHKALIQPEHRHIPGISRIASYVYQAQASYTRNEPTLLPLQLPTGCSGLKEAVRQPVVLRAMNLYEYYGNRLATRRVVYDTRTEALREGV